MELPTSVAKTMHVVHNNTPYDRACKRLFAEKYILAFLLKECIAEFKTVPLSEIAKSYIEGEPQIGIVPVEPDETTDGRIRGRNAEDSTVYENTDYFDILFDAILPGTRQVCQVIINFEVQLNPSPGYPMPKRELFYSARLLSSQNGTVFADGHYEKLRKVYGIWVFARPPQYRQNTINRYTIQRECVIGNTEEPVENYDLIEITEIFMGDEATEGYNEVLRFLDVILNNTRTVQEKKQIMEEDFHIPMTKELDEKVTIMCNLSEGILQQGIQKGLQQGIQQGVPIGSNLKSARLARKMYAGGDSIANIVAFLEEPEDMVIAWLQEDPNLMLPQ